VTSSERLRRPAFYALPPGGWRDLLTLLHPPYTAWHLSYVAIGASVAPDLHVDRLGAALAAFFLAVGIGAHALDELHGRPLGTQVQKSKLIALATLALLGAAVIGVVGVLSISLSLAPFVLAGTFILLAYNLELFGGRFHTDFWFAAAWGAFPALTGYWVSALQLRAPGVLVTASCFMLSVAQRRLSKPARELRRRTVSVVGEQRLSDGRIIGLDSAKLIEPLEGALLACAAGVSLMAAGLVVLRLT
jgi:hypothetical protein